MLDNPYKYMWREELEADYPMHIYITNGPVLIGYVKNGSTEVEIFKTPKRTWSTSRRKFRKLSKSEIDKFF